MVESININAKWIDNIYENVKKIEEFERLAREGCTSVLEYVQYPIANRDLFLAEIQYKNLKLLLNELFLVIPDIVPVIGETKSDEFMVTLNRIAKVIEHKENMIEISRDDVNRTIKDAKMTELFVKSLNVLHECREELILMIKHILYMEETRSVKQKNR